MTFLWLFVWVCSATPDLSTSPLNDWAIALLVCAFLDVTRKLLDD